MRYFGINIKTIVNNLVISYTDNGLDEAPVIIFIHGFPLNKTMWDNQVEALKEDYRVITGKVMREFKEGILESGKNASTD